VLSPKIELFIEDAKSKQTKPIFGCQGTLESFTVSGDGTRLAVATRSASNEREIRIIDTSNGETLRTYPQKEGISELYFDRTSTQLLVIGDNQASAKIVPLDAPAAVAPAAIAPAVDATGKRVRWTDASARLKQGAVGVLYKLLWANPELSQRMLRVINSGSERMSVDGLDAGGVRAIGRPGWLALMSDPVNRDSVLEAVNREVNTMSDALKARMRVTDKPFIPTLIIGSGPHGANLVSQLSRRQDMSGVAIVEATETLGGGNFASVGEMFRLNSREGVDSGARPRPGTDETLNKLVGPITPSDLGGARWNPAKSVAAAATVNAYASGAQFLMGSRIVEVQDSKVGNRTKLNWPGRYKVLFEGGREIYTDSIHIAAGLGKERLNFGDETTKALIQSEVAKIDLLKPDTPPQIMNVQAAFRYAQESTSPRKPYFKQGNKTPVTAVIGSGDSAKTFLELQMGLGPDTAYVGKGKDEPAQAGSVGQFVWLTGEKGFASCLEYLTTSRPRYAQASVALKAAEGKTPRIEPLRAKLANMRKTEDGRIELEYDIFESETKLRTEKRVVDRVILAAGFEEQLSDVFIDVNGGKDFRAALEDISGQPTGFDSPVVVARKLKDQEIYFEGPAAGQLPSNAELSNVSENKASLYTTSTRTQTFADDYAANRAPRDANGELKTSNLAPETASSTVVKLAAKDSQKDLTEIEIEAVNGRVVSTDTAAERPSQYVLARLCEALSSGIAYEEKGSMVVRVKQKRGKDGIVALTATLDGPKKVPAQFEAVLKDPRVIDALRILTDSKQTATFTLPVAERAGKTGAPEIIVERATFALGRR
jgi:hypothetical protein